jgi:malonyl-CoA O-methyltransferase
MFPESNLLLTDLSPATLGRCRARLGERHRYQPLDGENPKNLGEKFNLIASSLAFQWFGDLNAGLERLSPLLAPGGRLVFATLGNQTFIEWRYVHAGFGLPCGAPDYQTLEDFPWQNGFAHTLDEAFVTQHYANGMDFAGSLKTLGAGEPAAGHQPLPPAFPPPFSPPGQRFSRHIPPALRRNFRLTPEPGATPRPSD